MGKLFLIVFDSAILIGIATYTYIQSVTYLRASQGSFPVNPANPRTEIIPNSEQRDYCIFNNYECAEQLKSFIMETEF